MLLGYRQSRWAQISLMKRTGESNQLIAGAGYRQRERGGLWQVVPVLLAIFLFLKEHCMESGSIVAPPLTSKRTKHLLCKIRDKRLFIYGMLQRNCCSLWGMGKSSYPCHIFRKNLKQDFCSVRAQLCYSVQAQHVWSDILFKAPVMIS